MKTPTGDKNAFTFIHDGRRNDSMMSLPIGQAFASDVEDPWLIRLRGLAVVPEEDGTATPIGGDVSIDDQIVPEIDFSYFVKENIAFELVVATTPHDNSVQNSSLGNVNIGDVWLLPPTLLAQYHFSPRANIRPYVGAGIYYTFFLEQDVPDGLTSVNYDNNFGFALQAGVDIPVNETYFVNFDVKKLWLETDVTVDAGGLGILTAEADIDPWIFGVGVGRRF